MHMNKIDLKSSEDMVILFFLLVCILFEFAAFLISFKLLEIHSVSSLVALQHCVPV